MSYFVNEKARMNMFECLSKEPSDDERNHYDKQGLALVWNNFSMKCCLTFSFVIPDNIQISRRRYKTIY